MCREHPVWGAKGVHHGVDYFIVSYDLILLQKQCCVHILKAKILFGFLNFIKSLFFILKILKSSFFIPKLLKMFHFIFLNLKNKNKNKNKKHFFSLLNYFLKKKSFFLCLFLYLN